jgi:hypothetical protein
MKFRLLPRWTHLRKLGRYKFVVLFSATLTALQWVGDLIFKVAVHPEKYTLRFLGWGIFAFYMWRHFEASYKRYYQNKNP